MPEQVVFIHGLGRTPRSLRRLGRHLTAHGFVCQYFAYNSRRASIEHIVQQLHEQMPAHAHMVTHSLGGIVARAYAAQYPAHSGRMVMLAPPHHGSEIIDFWWRGAWRHAFFKATMGDLALSLHTGQGSLPNQLPVLPSHSIGIIAGTRSLEFWFNGLFTTPHDGKVSVASTRLAQHAHVSVHATHTWLMNHPHTRTQCVHFLHHGQFATISS
ncbi:MAG: esterase/lipase family protein [Formosimonas sp.]